MTTRIHFAGLNTAMFAEVLKGQDVLISYADIVRRPGVWLNEIKPRLERGLYGRVILDSGAFTELTTPGFHVDLEEYAEFVERYHHLFTVVVNLDDIGGDLARTWKNQERLEKTGAYIMPVFHGREPWSVLESYLENYGYVGVGFARDKGRISKDQGHGATPKEWLARVFRMASDREDGGSVKIHGFGMTSYIHTMHDYIMPTKMFYSTDSTTWIAEYRALKTEIDPGDPRHGTHGWLAKVLAVLSNERLAEIVVASYSARGGKPCPEAVKASKWQAQTVIKRFSEKEFHNELGTFVLRAGAIDGERWYYVYHEGVEEPFARMRTRQGALAILEDMLAEHDVRGTHN